MIDRTHQFSLARQAKVLGISRGSVCHLPTSCADLALMRLIDELKGLLRAERHEVSRLHVSRLMEKGAVAALYPHPNTSKPAREHKV